MGYYLVYCISRGFWVCNKDSRSRVHTRAHGLDDRNPKALDRGMLSQGIGKLPLLLGSWLLCFFAGCIKLCCV